MKKNKEQYIVNIHGINKRYDFIKYIRSNFKLKFRFNDNYMANSKFPFVVDFKRKDFWVCESITCCAIASQNNRIITEENFKEIIGGK